jgi:amphi-Trp domain-containing protein
MSKKEKRSVSYEARIPVQEALAHLADLQSALESGTVRLQNDLESLTLQPKTPVTIEIDGYDKGSKQALKISLKWETYGEEPAPEPKGFVISGSEDDENGESSEG